MSRISHFRFDSLEFQNVYLIYLWAQWLLWRQSVLDRACAVSVYTTGPVWTSLCIMKKCFKHLKIKIKIWLNICLYTSVIRYVLQLNPQNPFADPVSFTENMMYQSLPFLKPHYHFSEMTCETPGTRLAFEVWRLWMLKGQSELNMHHCESIQYYGPSTYSYLFVFFFFCFFFFFFKCRIQAIDAVGSLCFFKHGRILQLEHGRALAGRGHASGELWHDLSHCKPFLPASSCQRYRYIKNHRNLYNTLADTLAF
jgi:hypothetical protein